MKIYEYLVRLKENASSKLERMGKAAGQTNSKVSSLTSTFGGLGRVVAGLAIGATLFTAAKASAMLGIEMEQTRVSFTTFLKDADKANKVIAQLNEFSNVTPFDNASVLRAGKSLLAFGVSAKELEPTLRRIGDISAGTGKNFNELAVIYGKAKIAGTLYAEDINQLVDAGIPILGEFTKSLGTTEDQVKKMASQGKLKFKDLETAFGNLTGKGGMFFDLMAKQSETVGGKISTFQGKMQTVGISIGEAFNPILSKVFGKLIQLIDDNQAKITAWAKSAATHLQSFADKLISVWHWLQENKTMLQNLGLAAGVVFSAYLGYQSVLLAMAIKTKVLTAAQWLLNGALNANPIGLIVAGIAALVAIIAIVIKKYNEWGAALTVLLGPFGFVISLVQSFRMHWDSIKQAFADGGIVAGIKRIGLTLLDAVLMPLQQLLDIASKLPGTMGNMAAIGSKSIEVLRKKLNLLPDGIVQATPGQASQTAAGQLAEGSGVSTDATGGAAADLKSGIDAINGGGAKQTNINITFGNLIGEQSISVTGTREAVDDMVEMIEEGLLRVLNSANQIATQ